MIHKIYSVQGKGDIHYWVSGPESASVTLVFLPGLTADHRLFDKQISFFERQYRTIVWDAPGHCLSRPWSLDFSLMDMAAYLREILLAEAVQRPVIVGQSLGGYVAQCYMQSYPSELTAFVSIDSAPLQRKYMSAIEIFLLKHTATAFRCYSWKTLLYAASKGCAVSEYGRELMRKMMSDYSREEYIALSAYGYRILAEAIEADLPYRLDCPTLLICGQKDMAGYVKTYNKAWSKSTGLSVLWIEDAGHNSNCDKPDEINAQISSFVGVL